MTDWLGGCQPQLCLFICKIKIWYLAYTGIIVSPFTVEVSSPCARIHASRYNLSLLQLHSHLNDIKAAHCQHKVCSDVFKKTCINMPWPMCYISEHLPVILKSPCAKIDKFKTCWHTLRLGDCLWRWRKVVVQGEDEEDDHSWLASQRCVCGGENDLLCHHSCHFMEGSLMIPDDP